MDFNKWAAAMRLMESFPGSHIRKGGYFTLDKTAHWTGFYLDTCTSVLEVKCKVLEFMSGDAAKAQYWKGDKTNARYRAKVLAGINDFLGTQFSHEDIVTIYNVLGNGRNKAATVVFVQEGYEMGLLRDMERGLIV